MLFSSLKTQVLLIALVSINGFIAPIALKNYVENQPPSASEKQQKTPSNITKKIRLVESLDNRISKLINFS